MYDLRRTMYDLNASAPVARENGRRAVSAYGQRGCAAPEGRTADGAAVSQHARRPQAAARQLLMYDGRFSMYDGGTWRCLCTMYDVRCTIAKFARVARRGGGRRGLPMYEVNYNFEAG